MSNQVLQSDRDAVANTRRRGRLAALRAMVFFACASLPLCAWSADPARRESAALTDLGLEQLMEMQVELVYGASRYEQKVTRAPSSVSIVTAEEIKRYG
ncbi:MAG: hypothetical protein ACREV5_04075, partial [Steroidobacter sp.]